MEEEDFIEQYIAIGIDSFEDAEAIFKLSSKYLTEIKESGYDNESSTFVEGLLNKMISIAEHFELDESLIQEIEGVSKNFIAVFNQPNQNTQGKLPHFNKAYSVAMKFYNAMVKTKPKSNVNFGPFKPNLSDKDAITLKISEAIDIISKSDILTDKVKKKLTDSLNSVISELHKPTTNWNVYFKNVGYAVMLLGSLGSIVGGAAGYEQIMESKEKLEQANDEVQQSSISISKKDIKEAFIISENVKIDVKETLQIEAKKK